MKEILKKFIKSYPLNSHFLDLLNHFIYLLFINIYPLEGHSEFFGPIRNFLEFIVIIIFFWRMSCFG